ncbi:MAG: glycosyltransferase family 39 protein [Deltaproteobacteria bacterium]|nr:glycosyltransferase family 39 protein [Deltaproteobacteria bacterium]MBW2359393.1 glycosyltransferase family 39 protein [Deltaproteobacteria bacterium]
MKRPDFRTALWLFAAAFIVRGLPASSVFSQGTVFLRDGDAYYHLRRALFAIENFPHALVFDSYVQFPHGSKIIWPAFLDTCFAILLWPFVQIGGFDLAARAAAWLPPLLGALTVVVTWAITRRHFGERAALWAGGLLCVLGGHFVSSRLGALDHHVAISLVSVVLLGCTLRMLAGTARRRDAGACGVVAGVALLIWPGCLLYVGLALAGLATAALFAPERQSAAGRWHDLAWVSSCAGIVVAPFSLGAEWPQWSSMSPVVLTNFQPWLLGSTAALALLSARAAARAPFGASAAGRVAVFSSAGALLLLASVLISEDLTQGFADAWRWLGKKEALQGGIMESQPLFVVGGRVSGYRANLQLSPIIYAFPLLWLYGCNEARRSDAPGPRYFLLGWTGVLLAMTVLQKRFLDAFTVAFAMQTAVSVEGLWRRSGLAPDGIIARLAPLAALAVLFPLHANYTPHIDNLLRAFQDEPLRLSTYHRADRILNGVSRWLRTYTPTTSGWLDPTERPEYGVLARWSTGHLIQQVGRRPTVTDNFGDVAGAENFALEQRFWSAPPHEADRILERLGVRYVVVAEGDPFIDYYDNRSMYRTLFRRDGSGVLARPGEASTRAAGRYRLLMESIPLGERTKRPFAKVFEFVPGARLRGRTTPDTKIGLSLHVDTNRGRRFSYRDRMKSGPEGHFEFVVPYANEGGPDWLKVGERYAVRCGLATHWTEVSEQQVRNGETVRVGDPCSAAHGPVQRRKRRD